MVTDTVPSTYREVGLELHAPSELGKRPGLCDFALGTALERGEINLLYQPKLDMYTGRVVGVEAMPVWRPGEHSVMAGAAFIRLAERHGCREAVEAWGIQAVCRQAIAWHRDDVKTGPITFPVSRWPRRTTLTGVRDPSCPTDDSTHHDIHLEWDHRAQEQKPGFGHYSLEAPQPCGIAIVFQDLPTAISNLSHLRRIQAHSLILAPALTQQLHLSNGRTETLRHVIAVGHTLGLRVIAQGIDNFAQAGLMIRLGCRVAQGLAYAPAMSAARFTQWFKANSAG